MEDFKALITHVLWSPQKGPKERGLFYNSRPVQGSHPAKKEGSSDGSVSERTHSLQPEGRPPEPALLPWD